MPQAVWSAKHERMYEHVQASCLDKRGRSAKAKQTCKRIAAATVNKQRVREGVTKTGVRCACPRGYRVLKADKNKCWSPGKKRRGKTCY
jgi:hypothetical protein